MSADPLDPVSVSNRHHYTPISINIYKLSISCGIHHTSWHVPMISSCPSSHMSPWSSDCNLYDMFLTSLPVDVILTLISDLATHPQLAEPSTSYAHTQPCAHKVFYHMGVLKFKIYLFHICMHTNSSTFTYYLRLHICSWDSRSQVCASVPEIFHTVLKDHLTLTWLSYFP